MILGINHVGISVPDMDKALEFYRDLLGFEQVREAAWEPDTIESAVAELILAAKGTGAKIVYLKAKKHLTNAVEHVLFKTRKTATL